jgi:hypothetical protein
VLLLRKGRVLVCWCALRKLHVRLRQDVQHASQQSVVATTIAHMLGRCGGCSPIAIHVLLLQSELVAPGLLLP